MEDDRLKQVLEGQLKYDHRNHTNNDYPEDHEIAKALQEQFNHEYSTENPRDSLVYSSKKKQAKKESTRSLVDPSWELVDPTPNIHQLFVTFDTQFFWKKLQSVCVSWSKRMYSCAGICSYNGRGGGLCSITLSEPLLKLRPRKDLVETLLHEMIHAFLFLTERDRDRDGHGPRFHEHMYRINKEAGTNITVYHTFYDEVKLYKTHWWKCDGPCQHRHPFYGMVRRSMNRAPGKNDRWWDEHSRTCGGTFIKVKEPDPKKPLKKKEGKENEKPKAQSYKALENVPDIRNYFPNVTSPKNLSQSATGQRKPINTNNNLNWFRSGEDDSLEVTRSSKEIILFQGKGNILSKKRRSKNVKDPYSKVRNHWQKQFSNNDDQKAKRIKTASVAPDIDRQLSVQTNSGIQNNYVYCKHCNERIADVDANSHVHDCANASSSSTKNTRITDEDSSECDICMKFIPLSDWKDHEKSCLINMSGMIDTSLRKECPLCFEILSENLYDTHVAACVSKGYDELIEKVVEKAGSSRDIEIDENEKAACLICKQLIYKRKLNEHLDRCLSDEIFNDDAIRNEFCNNEKEDDSTRKETICISDDEDIHDMVACPSCFMKVSQDMINQHLDSCLS